MSFNEDLNNQRVYLPDDVWREIFKKLDIRTLSYMSVMNSRCQSITHERGVNRQIHFDSSVSQNLIAELLDTFGVGCRSLKFARRQPVELATLQRVKPRLSKVERLTFRSSTLENELCTEIPHLFPSLTTVSFKMCSLVGWEVERDRLDDPTGFLNGLVNSSTISHIDTREKSSDFPRLRRMTEITPVGQFHSLKIDGFSRLYVFSHIKVIPITSISY